MSNNTNTYEVIRFLSPLLRALPILLKSWMVWLHLVSSGRWLVRVHDITLAEKEVTCFSESDVVGGVFTKTTLTVALIADVIAQA